MEDHHQLKQVLLSRMTRPVPDLTAPTCTCKLVKVAKYILKPQLLAKIGAEMEDHQTMRRMWPPEARTPQFLQFIRDQYDQTQQAAIEVLRLVHGLRHVCRN
jgi:hypothetical protein